MKLQFKKEKSITCGVLVVKLCVLLVIAVAWTGCDDPPPPPPRPDNPWNPCECDAEEVVLSFGITDLSRFTVDPDRSDSGWKYRKGELVTITYELRAADRFLYWEVDPPSHLAHWSQALTIHVYMTDNTLVAPLVMAEGNIVYITIGNNHPAWTTVSPEPGTYPYTYGTDVSISASPIAGKKVVSWGGKKTGSAGSWGNQFTNPITVKAVGNYTFSPDIADVITPVPTLYNASVTLTGDGTADIFCAAIPATGAFGVAPFNTSSAECSTHFDARCLPHPGFDLTYFRWTHDNGATWNYLTALPPAWPGPVYSLSAMNGGDIPVAGWDGANFEANLTRTVSLDIETQGLGVVTSPDFKTHWNPQIYEPGRHIGYRPSALVHSNEVVMTADACPGWEFSHWEIEDENGNWNIVRNTSSGLPDEGDLTVYMNWWTSDDEYHVPSGMQTLNVRAVFLQPWIILLSGYNVSGSGGPEQSGMNILLGYLLYGDAPLQDCYRVDLFDEALILEDGSGDIYDDIVEGLEELTLKSIALVGHSRGGGSIFDLCNRLASNNSEFPHNSQGIRHVSVLFTGYVDAISQGSISAETRFPPMSQRHYSIFQNITTLPIPLNGSPTIGGTYNLDINTLDCAEGNDHWEIVWCEITHLVHENGLDFVVCGKDIIQTQDFCTDHNCFNN